MKKIITAFAIVVFSLCAFAATDVQTLSVGNNILTGGPGRITRIDAFSSSANGTVTVKSIVDTWSYDISTCAFTNSFTNAVSWYSVTVTNKVVGMRDLYTVVTNAVYTNVVGSATNVVFDTNRLRNGYEIYTNDVIITRPAWTLQYVPFKTSAITNDVVSHAVYTNTVGTITLSGHVGTLTPTNLYFTAGDIILVESEDTATLRLYSEND